MKISDLLKESGVKDPCKIINEKEFEVFSRITTTGIKESKCIFLAEKKYISLIPENVKMIITTEELADKLSAGDSGICICVHPKALYFKLMDYVARKSQEHFKTIIGKNCTISPLAYIAPNDVIIGDNVVIEEFVCIYEGCEIGNGCVIHAGSKISVQDYNYYSEAGKNYHLYHSGKTILEENVDVGFNSSIGRALYRYGKTVIGSECKIGTSTSIGHDCNIGDRSEICAHSDIGGHTVIGKDAMISIGSFIKNSLIIGDDVYIGIGSVVIHNIENMEKVFGNPAKKILAPKM